VRVHMPIKPFACTLCDFRSKHRANLARHCKKLGHGIGLSSVGVGVGPGHAQVNHVLNLIPPAVALAPHTALPMATLPPMPAAVAEPQLQQLPPLSHQIPALPPMGKQWEPAHNGWDR
jgi:hypothetical protein